MMIDMTPLNLERLMRKYKEGASVFFVDKQRSVKINSISKVGTGFQLVWFIVDGKQEKVLLDPGGRSTQTGEIPFWEIWQ